MRVHSSGEQLQFVRRENILVHLWQGLLSPGVIRDFLWVSLDFQPSWHLSSQEIQKHPPKVVCLWKMTQHPLQPGQWLIALQASGPWASNKASTVGSTAFSGVRFGKFSFVIFQPFSFKHSPNRNLVNFQFFGNFCQCRIDKLLPLPLHEHHCRPPSVRLQVVFLWPLGSPSSDEPCKSWIWPLPTAWRLWQWNLCKANN